MNFAMAAGDRDPAPYFAASGLSALAFFPLWKEGRHHQAVRVPESAGKTWVPEIDPGGRHTKFSTFLCFVASRIV